MAFVSGLFLMNVLCAIVPCQRFYDPPVPVPVPVPGDSPNPNPNPYPNLITNSNRTFSFEKDQDRKGDDFSAFPVVRTRSGRVRGYRMKTIRARNIFAFTGIPFARAPVGNLRYRSPVRKEPWDGIYDATKAAPPCLQISAAQQLRIIGKEDCLFLNVYTPKLSSVGGGDGDEAPVKIPVMVFIHGGSFAFSSGSIFGPSYLLNKDVILVTLNYRLSSQGFLSTGDEVAPGNWGLKDQNLALKWVHENIDSFGGDISRITLFGQSAGLFQAGISQSGSAFCYWGVRQDSVDYTYRLAARLRCPVNDSRLTLECLRRTDAHLIAYHEATLPQFKFFPGVFFGPTVEPPGPDSFLDDWPINIYAKKEVDPIPWINGFLGVEGNGLAFLTYLYPLAMQEVDRRWSELSHLVLDIRPENFRLVTQATAAIRQYYMGDQKISFYSRRQLANMYGDRLITTGVHLGLQYHSKVAPTYGYFFNYTGRYSTADSFGLSNYDWGISHDDDLMYFLNSSTYQSLKVGEPEFEMSELLITLWTNFATTRNPSHSMETEGRPGIQKVDGWRPVQNVDNVELIQLDGNFPRMISQPYLERIRFWQSLGLLSDSVVGPFGINTSLPFMQHNLWTAPAKSSPYFI